MKFEYPKPQKTQCRGHKGNVYMVSQEDSSYSKSMQMTADEGNQFQVFQMFRDAQMISSPCFTASLGQTYNHIACLSASSLWTWVKDSGAFDHMTMESSILFSFHSASNDQCVTSAHNSTSTIQDVSSPNITSLLSLVLYLLSFLSIYCMFIG